MHTYRLCVDNFIIYLILFPRSFVNTTLEKNYINSEIIYMCTLVHSNTCVHSSTVNVFYILATVYQSWMSLRKPRALLRLLSAVC